MKDGMWVDHRSHEWSDDALSEVWRLLERPEWHREALCRGSNPAEWFPERGDPHMDQKRLCGACPVREVCLEDALSRGEQHGIWGGTSERQRRQMRRARRAA